MSTLRFCLPGAPGDWRLSAILLPLILLAAEARLPAQNRSPGNPAANRGPVGGQANSPAARNGSGRPGTGAASAMQGPRRPAGPVRTAAQPGPQGRSAMQPSWVPLPEKHAEYVDQILAYWEYKSSQIERFRCTFKRWEYDPVFGPRETFYRYSEGQIKYAKPDKGLFQAEKVLTYQAPTEADEKPRYVESPQTHGEHWLCDGESVYELDHQRKQLIETQLPPDMRGNAIRNGPLPFLFGAKKETIKQRYWVRVITPSDVKGEYWLEAYPKTREDGANFKMVHIILDEKDYLPKGLVLFDRSFIPGRHPARTTFSFEQRETNWNVLAQQLNIFYREFYEPKVPRDWERVVNKYEPNGPSQVPVPPRQAAGGNGQRSSR